MSEQYTALKALADETRLRVIGLLAKRAYCVRALARKVGVSESAVSQHMKILKNAGLVTGVKWGYHMHYQVNREALRALNEAVSALSEPVPAFAKENIDGQAVRNWLARLQPGDLAVVQRLTGCALAA